MSSARSGIACAILVRRLLPPFHLRQLPPAARPYCRGRRLGERRLPGLRRRRRSSVLPPCAGRKPSETCSGLHRASSRYPHADRGVGVAAEEVGATFELARPGFWYWSAFLEIRSSVCSTLARNRSPRPASRWSNQLRACSRSRAARLLMRTGRVNGATGAAGGGPSDPRERPATGGPPWRPHRTSQAAGAAPPQLPGLPAPRPRRGGSAEAGACSTVLGRDGREH